MASSDDGNSGSEMPHQKVVAERLGGLCDIVVAAIEDIIVIIPELTR